MTWFEQNIEEPIRDTVKLLRDNGFNTYCSCGHEMQVDIDLSMDGEVKRLHDLLVDNGCQDYELSILQIVHAGITVINSVTIKQHTGPGSNLEPKSAADKEV